MPKGSLFHVFTGGKVMSMKFSTEKRGGVLVVTMLDKKLLDETNIQIFGRQLFALVEDGHRNIAMDFSRCEYFSSAALGKLMTMNKKVEAAGGKWILCCMKTEIYSVFVDTRLDKIFTFKATVDEAVAALAT